MNLEMLHGDISRYFTIMSPYFIFINLIKRQVIQKDKPIGVQSEQKNIIYVNQDAKYSSTHNVKALI